MSKKNRVARVRHRARELAVQLLYSMEMRPEQELDKCLNAFVLWGFASSATKLSCTAMFWIDEFLSWGVEPEAEVNNDVKDYMTFLTRGVWNARPEIDDIIRRVVIGWRPERMVAVDRAVLSLAIFEGFISKEIPLAVTMSEATNLANAFGTKESAKFVNGVLTKVLQFMESGKDGA